MDYRKEIERMLDKAEDSKLRKIYFFLVGFLS